MRSHGDSLGSDPGLLFTQALHHHQAGRLAEAISAYQALLAIRPEQPDALCNLGAAFQAQGRLAEAIASYERAIAARPDYAQALSNLGTALRRAGRLEDAISRFEEAAAAAPGEPGMLANLANCLREIGRTAEAVARCEQALALEPRHPEALATLAGALQRQGRLSEAVARYEQALALRPEHPEILSNLGMALLEQGRIAEAIACFEHVVRTRPDHVAAHSNLLLAMCYPSDISNDRILGAATQFAAQFEPRQAVVSHLNRAEPDRRLRIGYVSADFNSHSVAIFLAGVLAAHDAAAVETICYSNGALEDSVTAALRQSAGHWRRILGLADGEVARLVRDDEIDILVDLSGHTAGHRLLVFAMKPAPVQVTWLGYPGTTGLAAIDYRLVDAVTDPPGEADSHASETLLRLPGPYICYGSPPADAPSPSAPPFLGGSPLTFGSFNNPAKLSDRTLDSWASLLARQPDSRLLLKGKPFGDAATAALFRARLQERGVAPERVELIGWRMETGEHLALYGRIDIALDPFPYNGTTTTCEALWMGVPVVTLRGDRHAARVGATLLEHVGLGSLVAGTPEDYVAIALELARTPKRLEELRHTIRGRLQSSPLCEPIAFTRGLEQAYRTMWRRWCAGRPA